MRLAVLAILALIPGSTLCAQSASPTSITRRGLETITQADVKRRIGIIADDSMRGRDTPSPGLEATARYIASEFRAFGLTPAGDSDTFIQRYPLPGGRPDAKPGARTRTAPNVVGILEGSDPVLKNEYIVLS